MPSFVPVPRLQVNEFFERARASIEKARAAHASHFERRAETERNAKREGLTPGEVMERHINAKPGAKAAIRAAFPATFYDDAQALKDTLEYERLIEAARFLPPIVDGEAQAADTRRIAEHFERERYLRYLQRLGPDIKDEAARAVRKAGSAPDQSPALAEIGAMLEHARALPAGQQRLEAVSDADNARIMVFQRWPEHHELVEKFDQALRWHRETAQLVEDVERGRLSDPRLSGRIVVG